MTLKSEYEITEQAKEAAYVKRQADKPTGTTAQIKDIFDTYPELIRGKYNSLLDGLDAKFGNYRTSSAQDTIDSGKVDKVQGKGLSEADFTNEEKSKLAQFQWGSVASGSTGLVSGGDVYDAVSPKYQKPNSGIPKTDLASDVQTSLGKADTALQTHQDITGKVDKVAGKGLSSEDYTPAEKTKLSGIESGAQVNVITSDAASDNKTYGRKNGAWTEITGGGGGSSAWGQITGTLSDQTDLQTALNSKQDTLTSGTNIKTINSTSLLGSGNIDIRDVAFVTLESTWSDVVSAYNSGKMVVLNAGEYGEEWCGDLYVLNSIDETEAVFSQAYANSYKANMFIVYRITPDTEWTYSSSKFFAPQTTMPSPSNWWNGEILHYKGTTTSDYTHGHFYECYLVSGSTYAWREVDVQNLSAYRTASAQDVIDGTKESTSNKVTSVSSSSTDTEYPSAKCVYDAINEQYELIEEITLTEDTTNVARTQDLNGNNYNFKKILIDVCAKPAAVANRNLHLGDGTNTRTIQQGWFTSASDDRYTMFAYDTTGKVGSIIASGGNKYKVTRAYTAYGDVGQLNNIKSMQFSGTWATGSTFKIYAIWA